MRVNGGSAGTGPSLSIGAPVGRYVTLEEVGRGGMGRVLRAYDPSLQREVALKQLHKRVLDEDGSARLVREARAMAMLSHANVVAVYDVEAGDDGTLVIVMEFVPGQTLRAWLRDEPRDWRAVLRHFSAAGRGLAAAHAAGLLHRDFKPSNVLVGDDGVVKVTDFGLARGTAELCSAPGGSSELPGTDSYGGSLTGTGVLLGTPRYMAPEQERGEQLTPSADQYALCVALWEALCDEAPFCGKGAAEQKRKGPPPWPNAAVPRSISDAIERGLNPEPERRWPSMAALLDVLVYTPPQRRGQWFAALGAVAAVGLGAAGAQSWAAEKDAKCSGAADHLTGVWDEARRSEVQAAMLAVDAPYAVAAWERTDTRLEGYTRDWVAMHTEACEASTIRGEQSAHVMDLRIGCLQRAGVELESVTDVLAGADAEVVQKAHELVGGLAVLSGCADVDRLQADVEPPRPEETQEVNAIRRLVSEANAQTEAGHYDIARSRIGAAKDQLDEIDYEPVRTEVALQDADTLEHLGKYEASELALLAAMESATRWRQLDHMQTAATQLMFVVGARQQRPEALRYREMALGLSRGDARAEAAARSNLGLVLDHALGHYPEAEAEMRKALQLEKETLGADHPSVARTRSNLASVLQTQGEYEEAEAEHRRALEHRERVLGPGHPDVAASLNGLAVVLYLRGQYEEAEAEHRRALALRVASLGPEHPAVAGSHSNLAVVLFEQGRYAEAESEHRTALAMRERTLEPGHPEIAKSLNNLASTLYSLEKFDEAITLFRKALRLREAALGPDHPAVATGRSNLAHVLLRLDRAAEALPLAEQAWNRRNREGISPGRQGDTAFVLARAVWATSEDPKVRARARSMAELALDKYADAGEAQGNAARRARAWLDEHP